MKSFLIFIFSILIFTGCANNVNIVLLPEEGGKVGKIEVEDKGKTTIVDKPYQNVELVEGSSKILTEKEVKEKYQEEISALPKEPKSFLLYFEWDSDKISKKSNKTYKKILSDLKENDFIYIEIIGHTDRAGNKGYNRKLSLKRAKKVEKLLIKNGIKKDIISIYFYGESAPLVKTADNIPRKVNRRVEVILK